VYGVQYTNKLMAMYHPSQLSFWFAVLWKVTFRAKVDDGQIAGASNNLIAASRGLGVIQKTFSCPFAMLTACRTSGVGKSTASAASTAPSVRPIC